MDIVIEFVSAVFYDSGSAIVKPTAVPVIRQLAEVLNNQHYDDFQIEVQGHTDDVPIHTPQFPSNWGLSAARATGVVRSLIALGVIPNRLRALSFADIAPKVSNRAPDGTPLLQNQDINCRLDRSPPCEINNDCCFLYFYTYLAQGAASRRIRNFCNACPPPPGTAPDGGPLRQSVHRGLSCTSTAATYSMVVPVPSRSTIMTSPLMQWSAAVCVLK